MASRTGLTLSVAGDTAALGGFDRGNGDAQVAFVLSPGTVSFVNASVIIELKTPAGTWVPYQTIDQQFGTAINGAAFTPANGATKSYLAPFQPGAYIDGRVRLVSITSGIVAVEIDSGRSTGPTSAGQALAQMQFAQMNTLLRSLVLGVSMQTDTDLVDAVGSTW